MAAARKDETTAQARRRKSVERKVSRMMSQLWRRHLASKGDRILALNPEKYPCGLKLGLVVSVRFKWGNRSARREIQRSFGVGKKTKVPEVLADEFLKGNDVIEWREG